MRVLMVLCDWRLGGAETAALEMTRALRGRCFVAVAAVRSGGSLRDEFAEAAAAVYGGLARFPLDPLAPMRVASVIRRHAADVVLIVDTARNALRCGLVGARMAGRNVETVCWCHSIPGGQGGDVARRLRDHRRAGRLGRVIFLTESQRRAFLAGGVPVEETSIVPNGIDLARFENVASREIGAPGDPLTVVQVANVMPDKDFRTLLAATGRLASARDDFRLVLVGRQTDSPEIAELIEAAGAGGRVEPAGPRRDIPALLGSADVFVLSTRSEVHSIATLEAMASGLPVVVSDIPAFDRLQNGRDAVKVTPGDAEGLSSALGRMFDSPGLRRALGQAASLHARQYSLERSAEALLAVLRKAVPADATSARA